MKNEWLARIAATLGRCRTWLRRDFDYRAAYRRADLDRDYWSIVGPASRDEFEALGRGKRQVLIDLGLTPSAWVLDVGCGTGQLTEALLDFLGPDGQYCGTDIAPEAVSFCRQRFDRPNFVFLQSEMTRLPIEDADFDFVYFGSVFTHLYPGEIRDLLRDVKRLLGADGQVVGDVFVGDAPDGFAGNRGMVILDRGHLLGTFRETGLDFAPLRSWTWQPGIERVIYRFTQAVSAAAPTC
ncbi:MAG: class I SAM-dependent methyltransferase [Planctomycetes bacterium]|nr:class I SAM-dependent methyltransferase [Planctomycetota bacterium]